MAATASIEGLPDLHQPYRLTGRQIADFRRDGHVLLRGVCSPVEIDAFRPRIRDAAVRHNRESRPLAERDAYGKAFLQTLNLRLVSAAVRRFVTSRRIGRIAAELMGVEGIRLFHEQSLFKEPGGGGTPWHQDQYYWPLLGWTTIGMWMPLVPCAIDMGAIRFASGSHRCGDLGGADISDGSEARFDRLVRERGYPVSCEAMEPGDATFHNGWTLHGTGPNLTDRMREAMVMSMYADGMRVAQPTNPQQEGDRINFLGGRAPGEFADGELNELIYRT
ncbi:MAG: phytanoyl-CoA dioxygenase family protein [Planctomycetes bacterium]|nr:phytanoyl-CoA dioxygenase family protein [Planctomycetota bacterium]